MSPTAIERLTAGQGVLFAVVGPSGSGKDTLIRWARDHVASELDVMFVRRVITRRDDTNAEDHDQISEKEFAEAQREGRFSITWEAHGLHYGLPSTLADHHGRGGIAVANGSRKVLGDLRAAFENLVVVHLQVSPGELARRLATRGRESPEEIQGRLERSGIDAVWGDDTVHLDNSGPVAQAGDLFCDLISAAANAVRK